MTAAYEDAKVFMAFSDITRLKVLELLRTGEKTATALQELLNSGQSTLSHHMKILIESGIVTSRKLGKWTYYSICETGGAYASKLLNVFTTKKEESQEGESENE